MAGEGPHRGLCRNDKSELRPINGEELARPSCACVCVLAYSCAGVSVFGREKSIVTRASTDPRGSAWLGPKLCLSAVTGASLMHPN